MCKLDRRVWKAVGVCFRVERSFKGEMFMEFQNSFTMVHDFFVVLNFAKLKIYFIA